MRGLERIGLVHRRAVRGRFQPSLVEDGRELLPVLGELDALGRRADHVDAIFLQRSREVQRRLAAKLHNHPVALFLLINLQHILERQRLEVEAVAGVVVGRNGLGIRIHHHALVAHFAEREARVHAAVVELDALADTVRAAAENHDFLFAARRHDFVFVAVAGVVVRREGLELRRARIHETIGRVDAPIFPVGPHGREVALEDVRELRVGETKLFRAAQQIRVDRQLGARRARRGRRCRQRLLHFENLVQLRQEPAVNLRDLENAVHGVAGLERVADEVNALSVGPAELGVNNLFLDGLVVAVFPTATKAARTGLERAQALLHGFLEGAADRHRLADGLHRGGQRRVGIGEFLERKARDLRHDVVNRGLKARRREARDVVAKLVERVADGELGGDFRDGESGRLRRERRGAGDARVHLDHDLAAGVGIDGELDVRAAGLDADLANDGERRIAHRLKFLVGEGHRRGHRDGVTGVHSHRIKILDRADDHTLILVVAHDLHLVFLPAEETFFDEHFMDGREVETVGADVFEFLLVVSDATARATERKRGANNQREGSEKFSGLPRFGHRFHRTRFGDIETDLEHALFENLAVLTLGNRLGFRADHLHAVFLQDTGLVELHREIERGLASERRQQGRRPLGGDDFFDHLERERFDVGRISELRIGHDRGRIGVDQNDAVTLFLERLARLGAGIVELARLADDDRTGADDEDGLQVSAFGHERRFRRGLRAPKRAASGKAGRREIVPTSPGASRHRYHGSARAAASQPPCVDSGNAPRRSNVFTR